MKLLRSGLPILILGAVVIFAIENWSPTVPLVILGTPTIALPLGLWLVMACGLGVLTIVAIALCLRFISPSQTTVFSDRPGMDSPIGPRDSPRKSQPFRGRSPAQSSSSTDVDDSQPLEDWEEFSRPRYEWEDWQSRSPSTPTPSASGSNPPQSSWFASPSPSRQAKPPKVTEVEFDQGRPSASRFNASAENWDDYEQAQKRNEWGDRPPDSPPSQDPPFQPSSPYPAAAGADNYQGYDDQRDDHRGRGYANDDYRDRAYGDPEYSDREYSDREYSDREDRGNSVANRDDYYRDDQYYGNDYGTGEEPYRPGPDVNEYGSDRDDDAYRESYPPQSADYINSDYRDPDYRDADYRDPDYRDADYQTVDYSDNDYRDTGYQDDYRDNPGYQEQRDYYGPNAQNDGGVAEGEPQEQFIFDYGDEAALDEFEATLDQSKVGQYRWQRPAVKRKTEDEMTEARSTVDEDLEALNDWDDWEEDPAAPRDAGGTNGADVDAPRPIREVQRHPIATQKSGSVYSFSYRQEDVGEAEPSPDEDSSQDIPAAAEPTPAAGQTSDPDSTTVTEAPDLPPDSTA